jgi:hypothetical protein
MESIDPVRTGSHKGGDLVISQLIPFTIGLARLIQGLLVVVFKMGGLLDIVVESLQGIPKLSFPKSQTDFRDNRVLVRYNYKKILL